MCHSDVLFFWGGGELGVFVAREFRELRVQSFTFLSSREMAALDEAAVCGILFWRDRCVSCHVVSCGVVSCKS